MPTQQSRRAIRVVAVALVMLTMAPPVQSQATSAPVARSISGAGYHTCSALYNGYVVCWGVLDYGINNTVALGPQVISGVSGVTSVKANFYHTCALGSSFVKCWGYGSSGQLGNGASTNSTNPVTVSGLTDATSVATGVYHTCAIRSSSQTVVCWGLNDYGQLGDGTQNNASTPVAVTGLSAVVSISAGMYHTCAVVSSGAVKCWGRNLYGNLGDGSGVDSRTPVSVTGISDAVSVAAGPYHTCAVMSTGGAKCWGNNNSGQLGNGTTSVPATTPVSVSSLSNAASVSLGFFHTCAALTTGAAKCWGSNGYGNLGDGSYNGSPTPVSVAGVSGVVEVNAARYHSCALLASGAAQCWGSGWYLGTGGAYDSPTPAYVAYLGGSLPAAPTAVVGSRGAGQVSVSWTAPSDTGGLPITGYTVTATPGGATCTTSGSTTCTVTGLTNGVSYTFAVTATNGAGVGPASAASASVIPATVPTSPTIGSVTVTATTLAVPFTTPASNGGSPITSFEYSLDGETWSSASFNPVTFAGSVSITGLTAYTNYTVHLRATNSVGSGAAATKSVSTARQTITGSDNYECGAGSSRGLTWSGKWVARKSLISGSVAVTDISCSVTQAQVDEISKDMLAIYASWATESVVTDGYKGSWSTLTSAFSVGDTLTIVGVGDDKGHGKAKWAETLSVQSTYVEGTVGTGGRWTWTPYGAASTAGTPVSVRLNGVEVFKLLVTI